MMRTKKDIDKHVRSTLSKLNREEEVCEYFFFIVYFERDCEINFLRNENALLNCVIFICVMFSVHDFVHYK